MSESDDPAATTTLEPEDQPTDDFSVDEAKDPSTQSISSSILRYRTENGRTYTAFGSGEYLLPNDEDEQERLGTGSWAVDVADEHPEAEVLGVDLSPIQPTWVPPNCSFQIDDLEKEWTFESSFDFIFIRSMIASFKSWPDIFSKAFNHLEPGGYIEVQDNAYPLASDDCTVQDTYILKWSEFMVEAANTIGRPINVAPKFESMLEDAGFVDIVVIRKRIPMNRWPKRSPYRDLGLWSCGMLSSSLEGISMGLLTRLGLTVEEVHVLLAKVRRDLCSTEIHGYWNTYLVYARKPRT
ncbi:unnamed protein product [Fusarium fujikuroi]|nr:unnamed protein product [Fusarium fujikuroi]